MLFTFSGFGLLGKLVQYLFVMTGAVDFKLIKREFIAGGTAGGIGIFLGFPFDLIKVNLQTHPDKFTSAWQCFKQIVKTEGYGGLYRGCIPPVMMQGVMFHNNS